MDEPVRKEVANAYHCGTLVGNWEEERKSFGAKTPKDAIPTGPMEKDTTYIVSYKAHNPTNIAAAKPPQAFADEAPKELLFYHGDVTQPEKHQVSMHEMSYTDQNKEYYTNAEILDLPGVSRKQDKRNKLRSTLANSGGTGSRGELAGQDGEGTGGERSFASTRESRMLRSMNSFGRDRNDDAFNASRDGGYAPPSIPPEGRVAERQRLLTTKHVTIDATGEHLFENPQHYPLTSSKFYGDNMRFKDNPMCRTKLRIDYTNDPIPK